MGACETVRVLLALEEQIVHADCESDLACRETIDVNQGDTSAILLVAGPADVTDPGWTCRLSVVRADGTVAIAARAVTDTETVAGAVPSVFFQAFLTPAETATLAPGDYTWAVEVINTTTTPPFNVEVHQPLCVTEQLIP